MATRHWPQIWCHSLTSNLYCSTKSTSPFIPPPPSYLPRSIHIVKQHTVAPPIQSIAAYQPWADVAVVLPSAIWQITMNRDGQRVYHRGGCVISTMCRVDGCEVAWGWLIENTLPIYGNDLKILNTPPHYIYVYYASLIFLSFNQNNFCLDTTFFIFNWIIFLYWKIPLTVYWSNFLYLSFFEHSYFLSFLPQYFVFSTYYWWS